MKAFCCPLINAGNTMHKEKNIAAETGFKIDEIRLLSRQARYVKKTARTISGNIKRCDSEINNIKRMVQISLNDALKKRSVAIAD